MECAVNLDEPLRDANVTHSTFRNKRTNTF